MKIFIYILLGVVVGIIISRFIAFRKRKTVMSVGEKALKDLNEEKKMKREERKRKIMELFKKQEKVTNNDVEKLLGVSDASVTSYFDELEAEGKIKQIGGERRNTYYVLKKVD